MKRVFLSFLVFVCTAFTPVVGSVVQINPIPNAEFFNTPIESLDVRSLTIAVGMPGRNLSVGDAMSDFDAEREAVLRDAMIRSGVDLAISLLTFDPGGAVLAIGQGVVSYLGFRSSEPPGQLNNLGGVQVLTLVGPDYLEGLGFRSESAPDLEENAFFTSYQFNYDALAMLLTELRFTMNQPTVYENDGFRLGAGVAVDNDDRIVVAAPGLRFNFWSPPALRGGSLIGTMAGGGSAYPYGVGLYSAFETEDLQAVVGQMRFDDSVPMDEAVRRSRAELARDVASDEGALSTVEQILQVREDTQRTFDGIAATSARINALRQVTSNAAAAQATIPANASRAQAVTAQFRGSLSRLTQTTAFSRAGRAANVISRAFFFVGVFDFGAEVLDLILGGGITTPARLSGSPHTTGIFDTIVPISGFEWSGIDPTLHWQSRRIAGARFADPRRSGHRTSTGYSMATRNGVLANISHFEGSTNLSVLDLYIYDSTSNRWMALPWENETLSEGLDATVGGSLPRPSRSPGADFQGTARQTAIQGNDVFVLLEEGGIFWFPERLRPDRDTFLTRHLLAQGAFYRTRAHAEGLGQRSWSNPRVAAPSVIRPVTEAFAEGRFPIALADWDASLGGSLAVAENPAPDVPGVAFGIPGARNGAGLLAVLAPTFIVEPDDRFVGRGRNLNGFTILDNSGEIILPPRIRSGGYFGFTGERHRQPYYGIQLVEVPTEVAGVTGLGKTVAMTSEFLAASDEQNRIHLWFFDRRAGQFTYVQHFTPEYRLNGRTIQRRGDHLRFTENTLIGTDVMTDGSHAVWGVALSANAELRVRVTGDAGFFPGEGIPVNVGREANLRLGRDNFTYIEESRSIEIRGTIPTSLRQSDRLELNLSFFAVDLPGLIGEPGEPFTNGTLEVFQREADGLRSLGRANRINESWSTVGNPVNYDFNSRWWLDIDPSLIRGTDFIIRYTPGTPSIGNHGDILALIVNSTDREAANRLNLSWIERFRGSRQFAQAPNDTVVFAVTGDRNYRVWTGDNIASNAPLTTNVFPGESVTLDLNVTGFNGVISGVLVSPTGQRLPQIPLALVRDGTEISQTETSGNGSFRLTGAIPGGQDVITLLDANFSIANGEDLPPGEVQLTLQSNITLEQSLLFSTGEPLIGVSVRLTNFRTGAVVETTTDENGVYRFSGLLPGTYLLSARPGSRDLSIGNFTVLLENGSTFLIPGNLDRPLAAFDATVELRNKITGELVSLNEDVFDLARSNRFPSSPPDWQPVIAFNQGRVELKNLDQQTTWLTRIDPDEGWFVVTPVDPDLGLPSGTFPIQAGVNVIEVVPYTNFSGQLSNSAEATWNTAGIQLILSGQPGLLGETRHFLTRSTTDGHFTFRVPSGTYTLRVEGGFLLDGDTTVLVPGTDTDSGVQMVSLDQNTISGQFLSGFIDEASVSLEWEGGSLALDIQPDGSFVSPRLDPRPIYTQWVEGTDQVVSVSTSPSSPTVGWNRYRRDSISGERILLESGEVYEGPVILGRTVNFKIERPIRWSVRAEDSATGEIVIPFRWYLKNVPGVDSSSTWLGAFSAASAAQVLGGSDYQARFEKLNSPHFAFNQTSPGNFNLQRLVAEPNWLVTHPPAQSPEGTVVAAFSFDGIPAGGVSIEAVLGADGQPSNLIGIGPDTLSLVLLDLASTPTANQITDVTVSLRLADLESTLLHVPVRILLNYQEVPFHLGIIGAGDNRSFGPLDNPYRAGNRIRIDEQYFGEPGSGEIIAYIVAGLEVRSPAPVLEILDPSVPFEVSAYGLDRAHVFTLRNTALLDFEEFGSSIAVPLRLTDANGAVLETTVFVEIENFLDPVRATAGSPVFFEDEDGRWFEVELTGVILEDTVPQNLRLFRNSDQGLQAFNRNVDRVSLLPHPSGEATRRVIRIDLTERAFGETFLSYELRNFQTGGGVFLETKDSFNGSLPVISFSINPSAVPPRIVSQPLPRLYGGLGQRLEFAAEVVGGSGPVTYQWLRNGVAVPGANSREFTLAAANPEDAGIWQLRITNPSGAILSEPIEVILDLPGDLVVWGPQSLQNTTSVQVPQTLTDVVRAATTLDGIGVALRVDGTLANFRAFDNNTAPPFWNATGNANQQIIRDRLEALEVLPDLDRRVIAIAAGNYHFLALLDNGEVVAWGENNTGQILVPGDLPAVKAIFANGGRSGALPVEGGIRLWGAQAEAFTASFTESDTSFVDLAFPRAGNLIVLALRRDGSLMVWPEDSAAALEKPSFTQPVLQVMQSPNASYAVMADGSFVRWGETTILNNMPEINFPVESLFSIAGRIFALGRAGEMISWQEFHFGEYNWMPGFDWSPPGLGSGESLQTPLDAGINLRQVGILRPMAPRFAFTPPPAVGVPLNTPLRLEVTLQSTILPTSLQWFFEGVEIPGATSRILEIPHFDQSRVGDYHLTATNDYGTSTLPAVAATLLLPPEWESTLAADVSVGRGGTLTIESPATSETPVTYRWTFNGQPFFTPPGSTLQRTSVQANAAGVYTVFARNAGGEISRSFEVSVLNEPTLRLPQAKLTAIEGQSLILNPWLVGDLPTTFQWFLNDDLLAGETNASLDIASLDIDTAGVYRLVATNFVGSSETAVVVSLAEPGYLSGWGPGPLLSAGLQIPEALLSRSDFLRTALSGSHALALAANGSVVGWGSNEAGQLDLPDTSADPAVALAAAEGLSVILTRSGSVWTSSAALAAPSELDRVIDVAAGNDVVLALMADGSVTQWGTHPGTLAPIPGEVGPSSRILASGNHAYALLLDGTVVRWNTRDVSGIEIIASGNSGNPIVEIAVAQDRYVLLYADGTVFSSDLGVLSPGGSAPVTGLALGTATLGLTFADGSFSLRSSLNGAARFVPEGLPAVLSMASAAASNLGVVSAEAGPIFLTGRSSTFSPSGGNVSFRHVATASAPITYQWFFNGNILPGAEIDTLTLTNVTQSDAGVYNLHATSDGVTSVSPPFFLAVEPQNFQALRPVAQVPTLATVDSLDVDGDLLVGSERVGLFYITLNEQLSNPPFRLTRPAGNNGVDKVAANHANWQIGVTPPGSAVALIADLFANSQELSYARYPANFGNPNAYFPAGGNLQLPVGISGFTVKETTAYILLADRLVVVNVPVPTNMGWDFQSNLRRTIMLPESFGRRDIRISDGYLYVALGNNGLHVYDLSSPTNPRLVSEYSDLPVSEITFSPHHVFVTGTQGFGILAKEDLGGVREVGRIIGEARASAYNQGYLFVVGENGSIVYYDVSEPTAPIQLGGFNYFDEFQINSINRANPRRVIFSADSIAVWRDKLILGTRDHGVLFFDLGQKPSFSQEVQQLTALNGVDIYLVPEMEGSLPMTYQWFRNGELITSAPNEPFLLINGINSSTAGVYELVATNPFGTATSGPIVITVSVPEPAFTRTPGSPPVTELYMSSASIFAVSGASGANKTLHLVSVDSSTGVPSFESGQSFNFSLGEGYLGGAISGVRFFAMVLNPPSLGTGLRVQEIFNFQGTIFPSGSRQLPVFLPGNVIASSGEITLTEDSSRLASMAIYPVDTSTNTGRGAYLEVANLPSYNSPVAISSIEGRSVKGLSWLGNSLLATSRTLDNGLHEVVLLQVEGSAITVVATAASPLPVESVYGFGPDRIIASSAGEVRGYIMTDQGEGNFLLEHEWTREFSSTAAPRFRPDPENPGRLLGTSDTEQVHFFLNMSSPSNPFLLGPISISGGWVRDRIRLTSTAANRVYEADPLRGLGYRVAFADTNNPPAIASVSTSPEVIPGAPFSFSVALSGSPAGTFHYQWFRDGQTVGWGYTGSFEISSIGIEDIGSYSVTVTSLTGSVSASLGDIDGRPFLGIPTEPILVDEFDTFTAAWGLETGATFTALQDVPPGLEISPGGNVEWTPGEEDGGETWLTLLEVQVGDLSFDITVVFTAVEVNHAPVSNRGPVPAAIRNRLWLYDLMATDSDLPAQTLTYELIEGPETMDVSMAGILSWRPAVDAPLESIVVRVRISDGIDFTDEVFAVSVVAGNTPPRFVGLLSQFNITQGNTLSVQLVATDDEQADESLIFGLGSGPAGLELSPAGLLTWDLSQGGVLAGDYTAQLQVNDGSLTTTRTVTLRVQPGSNTFAAVREQDMIQHFTLRPDELPTPIEQALLRFAFGRNTESGEPLPAPAPEVVADDDLTPRPALRFIQRSGGMGTPGVDYRVDGVRYQVEVSTNLLEWFHGANFVELVGNPQSNGDGTETVVVRAKVFPNGSEPQFIRLRIISEP
jgi:hypothetical protein